MSRICRIFFVFPAALLLAADQPIAAPQLVRKTYPVADLVIPEVQAGCGQDNDEAKREAGHTTSADYFTAPQAATTEAQLMRLIRDTVQPATWSDGGGPGTIDYFAKGKALIVSQMPDVHEEIADLLAALRRISDVQVGVQVLLLCVSESFYTQEWKTVLDGAPTGEVGAGWRKVYAPEPVAFLDGEQLFKLLEGAQGDRRTHVLAAPKVVALNGRKATVNVTDTLFFLTGLKEVRERNQVTALPQTREVTAGFRLAVLPAVSADRRSVLLKVTADITRLGDEPKTVPVTTRLTTEPDAQGERRVVPVQHSIQQPSIQTLAMDTCVRIAVGRTAVLKCGTWMGERRDEYYWGPDVLSEIPYLNQLFTDVGYGRPSEQVFLLITPRILVHGEEQRVGGETVR